LPKKHSCIVDDGHGDRVELLDEQGCAKDKYLLQNLDYVTDLMVGKEAHVYKYADRERLASVYHLLLEDGIIYIYSSPPQKHLL
jgi:hypothetical protein